MPVVGVSVTVLRSPLNGASPSLQGGAQRPDLGVLKVGQDIRDSIHMASAEAVHAGCSDAMKA